MTIHWNRGTRSAALLATAATMLVLFFSEIPKSRLAKWWSTSPSQSLEEALCEGLPWEDHGQGGTVCVQYQGQTIGFEISLEPDIVPDGQWKLEVAHLWMRDNEGEGGGQFFQYMPEKDEITSPTNNLVTFPAISVSNDLGFSCPQSSKIFTAQASITLSARKNSTQQHEFTSLDTNLSFRLSCSNGLRDRVTLESVKPADKELASATVKSGSHPLHDKAPAAMHERRTQGDLPRTDWLNRERNVECAATNENIRSPNTLLGDDFLRKAFISEYLTGNIAYDDNLIRDLDQYQQVYDYFHAWDDGVDDVSIVVKIEGACYGAFRPTDPFNFNDLVVQNMNPTAKEILDSNCFVRGGYYDAYFTNYRDDFESKLQTCIDSCTDGPCEVIFTGGSQGAGPAVVASVVYKDVDPLVITWGGAKAFYRLSPRDNTFCTEINPQNHYRMVLTEPTLGLVDIIPFQWAFSAEHVGHEILFDRNDLNYMGVNPATGRNWARYNLAVHIPANYNLQTRLMYENVCLPAPAHGWIDGHWCAQDEDCESELCYLRTCRAKFDAESICLRDENCQSNVCNRNVWRCTAMSGMMENEMACQVDEDCSSSRCESRWIPFTGSTCQEQLETGSRCDRDSDCSSGDCSGILFRRRCE